VGRQFSASRPFANRAAAILCCLDTCVKSEDFAQSGPGPASSATHHDTVAHLPAAGGGARRTPLTADQAVDIFHHKTFKTAQTASLLSAKYGISPKAVRDIWTLKRWVQKTRPFWTRLDEQESLANGTHVESKDFAQSGPGSASGATHHDTVAHLPAAGGGARRTPLTADQAVDIFHHKTFKTTHTASLLSAKYGISPSAVRNIWNLNRWAQETRPFRDSH